MKRLLVDAGGTKSTWVEITDLKVKRQLSGPIHLQSSDIVDIPTLTHDSYDEVLFFGAGCTRENQHVILDFLSSRIHGNIKVKSDTEAAAIATMDNESGYIHIFGTGSAVNYWNGERLINPTVNLGYLWEDFASGYDFGRTIIQWWKRGKLTNKDEQILLEKLGTLQSFISRVYQKDNTKSFIANLALLMDIFSNKTRDKLIKERFEKYLSIHSKAMLLYPKSSHYISGGIAFSFQNQIRNLFQTAKFQVVDIISSPMDGLISKYTKRSL